MAGDAKATLQGLEAQLELNDQAEEEEEENQNETNVVVEEEHEEEPIPTQLTVISIKQKSVRIQQQLRIVIDEEFQAEQRNDTINSTNTGNSTKDFPQRTASTQSTGSSLQAQPLPARTTSILIDEAPQETAEFEETVIALPKSPMCVLFLYKLQYAHIEYVVVPYC